MILIASYVMRTVCAFKPKGGVEDTILGAKAKDTKKIQGQVQGSTFREQILSNPRTGMLEANDTTRKCSPKKSSVRKISEKFQAEKKGHDLSPFLTN